MRFKTRYDLWLVAVLLFVAVGWTISALVLQSQGTPFSEYWKRLIPGVILVFFTLVFCLPQYYEIRENDLFIRRGLMKKILPFSSIIELQQTISALSAPVFSMHRILITTTNNPRIIIAVAEEDRFLKEMLIRCPHLEKKPYGLGLPLVSPTSF